MPITLLTIDEIEERRHRLGIKMGKLCRRADIEVGTYHRRLIDKSGGLFLVMLNLNKAIAELELEAQARPASFAADPPSARAPLPEADADAESALFPAGYSGAHST